MDVSEWYTGPSAYDFNQYVEIMGQSTPQNLLRENGRADNGSSGVFSIKDVVLELIDDGHDHEHE